MDAPLPNETTPSSSHRITRPKQNKRCREMLPASKCCIYLYGTKYVCCLACSWIICSKSEEWTLLRLKIYPSICFWFEPNDGHLFKMRVNVKCSFASGSPSTRERDHPFISIIHSTTTNIRWVFFYWNISYFSIRGQEDAWNKYIHILRMGMGI
jgi:hypothetical protein